MKNYILSKIRLRGRRLELFSILCIVAFALPQKSIGQAPANDVCANAIALKIDDNPVSGMLSGATPTSGISSVYSSKNDVWYSFAPTCDTATLYITYNSNSNIFIYFELYKSPTCPLSGAIKIGNAPPSNSPYAAQFTALTIGAKYFIRIIDYSASSSNFTIYLKNSIYPSVPSLITNPASGITSNSDTLNGNIAKLSCPTTAKGFVYSLTNTNSNPINGGTGVSTMIVSGLTTGAYALALVGLTSGSGYSYKAFIYDGTTYTYGSVQTFTTTSNNADLTALSINSATISPTFTAATTAYSATVANAISSVTVTATKSNIFASIQLQINNGGYSTLSSGTASSSLILNIGSNTIDVKVTAQDGSTTKIYTTTVCRDVVPSVSISVSANPICSGASVTFTATQTNGGTPTYQWQKGGTNISGATASTYTSTNLTNNNAITVIMTSTATCANPTTATSNTVTMTVNALPVATTTTVIHDNCQVGEGAITLFISGGKPNYTISACGITVSPSPFVGQYVAVTGSPAIGVSSSKTFSGLNGNIAYNFTITDANGCVAQ